MKNLFFVLVLSLISVSAFSQHVPQRVSRTGTVFNLDTSVPALGEAYRDPSGLVWGHIVIYEGSISKRSQDAAGKYCQDSGARLPTIEEFEKLANYLGKGTSLGYSPYLANSKEEKDVLPGLSRYSFWSSSKYGGSDTAAYYFNGYEGQAYYYFNGFFNAVICVAGL